MSSGSEQRGFVFSVVFIIVFSALLTSIPVGLQGTGGSPNTLLPVDPVLLTGFSDTDNWTRTSFTSAGSFYFYDYSLGGFEWRCVYVTTPFLIFSVYRKVILWGIFWLGQLEATEFILENGTNRGELLAITEIDGDDDSGTVRYDLTLTTSGNDAGGFIFYWNNTLNAAASDAWDSDVLNLMHGIGIDSSATQNVGSLLVSLLFLQLPEVPTLVNVLIATPIWATIIYVLWYVIKEMIPFV